MLNKSETGKILLKFILSIFLVLIIIIFFIFFNYLNKNDGNVSGAVISLAQDVVGKQEPIFVLVMGVSDDIKAELTDTIMLLGYNPENQNAIILSIPRDTFIGKSEKNASGYDKINSLYQKSPIKTVEAVEQITGIKIDNYVVVKTDMFVKIIDDIGGINYDVPINMNYDDSSQNLHIHLKKGYQHLNGKQAEQLVRFRHNNNGTTYDLEYGDNDEGRMRTQREFVKILAKEVVSWNNVDKIESIIKSLYGSVETNAQISKILKYIPYAVEINTDDLLMNQIPGETRKINNLWFFEYDEIEGKKLIEECLNVLEINN